MSNKKITLIFIFLFALTPRYSMALINVEVSTRMSIDKIKEKKILEAIHLFALHFSPSYLTFQQELINYTDSTYSKYYREFEEALLSAVDTLPRLSLADYYLELKNILYVNGDNSAFKKKPFINFLCDKIQNPPRESNDIPYVLCVKKILERLLVALDERLRVAGYENLYINDALRKEKFEMLKKRLQDIWPLAYHLDAFLQNAQFVARMTFQASATTSEEIQHIGFFLNCAHTLKNISDFTSDYSSLVITALQAYSGRIDLLRQHLESNSTSLENFLRSHQKTLLSLVEGITTKTFKDKKIAHAAYECAQKFTSLTTLPRYAFNPIPISDQWKTISEGIDKRLRELNIDPLPPKQADKDAKKGAQQPPASNPLKPLTTKFLPPASPPNSNKATLSQSLLQNKYILIWALYALSTFALTRKQLSAAFWKPFEKKRPALNQTLYLLKKEYIRYRAHLTSRENYLKLRESLLRPFSQEDQEYIKEVVEKGGSNLV